MLSTFFPETTHTSRTTRIAFLLLTVGVLAFILLQFMKLTREYSRHEPKTLISLSYSKVPLDLSVLSHPLVTLNLYNDELLPFDIPYINFPTEVPEYDKHRRVNIPHNATNTTVVRSALTYLAALRIIGDYSSPFLGRLDGVLAIRQLWTAQCEVFGIACADDDESSTRMEYLELFEARKLARYPAEKFKISKQIDKFFDDHTKKRVEPDSAFLLLSAFQDQPRPRSYDEPVTE